MAGEFRLCYARAKETLERWVPPAKALAVIHHAQDLTEEEAKRIVQPIEDAKLNAATGYVGPLTLNVSTTPADASGNPLLFEP